MPGKKKGTEGLDKVEIVLVGEPRVGKTSMLRQLCRGTFSAAQQPTVGLDFERATLRVRRVAIDAIPGTVTVRSMLESSMSSAQAQYA